MDLIRFFYTIWYLNTLVKLDDLGVKLSLLELIAKYFMKCYNTQEQPFKTYTHTERYLIYW